MKTEKEIKEYIKMLIVDKRKHAKALADNPDEALILNIQLETLAWVIA